MPRCGRATGGRQMCEVFCVGDFNLLVQELSAERALESLEGSDSK
jgi:hypothetical protein